MERTERVDQLKKLLNERVLVIDGAAGTFFQSLNLTANDFGGEEYEGCNEYLILSSPHLVQKLHENYLSAGADIIETNTFGGTPLVLNEYNLSEKYYEINFKSAQLARKLADQYTEYNRARPRFVAGSIGPTTKAISVTGGVSFQELVDHFYQQAKALYDGGVDYFLLETCQDTRNIKAGVLGIKQVLNEKEENIPIAISGTIETMGTMLAGQSVESLITSLEHLDLLYLGLNCATGPADMADFVRTLSHMSPFPVAIVPNAGLPDEEGHYLEDPCTFSHTIERFLNEGWVNLIGGCCGTHKGHIAALCELVEGKKGRLRDHGPKKSSLSGIDYLEISSEGRPYLVGERTNVIGSKKFKDLIIAEKFDEASEIAKTQVKKGAHIIDVCLANPDRNEKSDMENFLKEMVKKIRAPIMIDSTDSEVIELALTFCQGKAIINSINLEDGEERFLEVVPLAKKYGAALVVGTIDDDPIQGMAVTRERKLAVAKRSYQLLTEKYGVAPEDIYWDPLVFPCGTGDENYKGSAVETIEGLRLIKEYFPQTKSVLGISNISFGLPANGREVLNSVFVYHCTKAGLDLAIVNSEKYCRYSSLTPEEILVCENLLWNRGEDPIGEFTRFFREKGKTPKEKNIQQLPLDKRLAQYILEGSKDGLINDLDLALKDLAPLAIINGPLMAGMDEVGRLFNDNQLIVAEVLQSAEVMKSAVAHLEQFMEKSVDSKKGKILLATVKGDVHDIGKNLVDIILSNNGYEVFNAGIKVASDQLIKYIKEFDPDIVGLSGLLVKSAQQMVTTCEDLKTVNIDVPVMVGGAALTRNFVNKKISRAYSGTVIYANDAMEGLMLANRIMAPHEFHKLKEELQNERAHIEEGQEKVVKKESISIERSPKVSIIENPPLPPNFERHVIQEGPTEKIWEYINPLMLYGRHLGMKGKIAKLLHDKKFQEVKNLPGGERSLAIYNEVESVKEFYRHSHFTCKAIYQFIKAGSIGNQVHLAFEKGEKKIFTFPRQAEHDLLCLSDYLRPLKSEPDDNLALFIVTCGKGISDEARRLKEKGDYLRSHILQSLAIESAEGYAEYLHRQLRTLWGHPDSDELSLNDIFQAKYHGKRFSFGYPACPELKDQELLFEILKPQEIGIELTEGYMMNPEASVSAIVFHHLDARYFTT